MSAGLEANPPQGISRDSEHHGSVSETARASLRLLEEHGRKVTALRQALIEGENSGEAHDLDIAKIKAKARQRPGS
jgi:antitoxin ParD1/3/4